MIICPAGMLLGSSLVTAGNQRMLASATATTKTSHRYFMAGRYGVEGNAALSYFLHHSGGLCLATADDRHSSILFKRHSNRTDSMLSWEQIVISCNILKLKQDAICSLNCATIAGLQGVAHASPRPRQSDGEPV